MLNRWTTRRFGLLVAAIALGLALLAGHALLTGALWDQVSRRTVIAAPPATTSFPEVADLFALLGSTAPDGRSIHLVHRGDGGSGTRSRRASSFGGLRTQDFIGEELTREIGVLAAADRAALRAWRDRLEATLRANLLAWEPGVVITRTPPVAEAAGEDAAALNFALDYVAERPIGDYEGAIGFTFAALPDGRAEVEGTASETRWGKLPE